MSHPILLSAAELHELIQRDACTVVDCRHDFADAEKGRRDWLSGHVPGAAHAHLDDDLSSPVTPNSGRHPLPEPGEFADYLANIGWRPGRLLVAYDASGNALAARAWWLMRYFGHPSALLDGGLDGWQAAGYSLVSGEEPLEPQAPATLHPNRSMVMDVADLEQAIDDGRATVLDARAAARFRGEVEPLDSRAGHIPGALNRPQDMNLESDRRFRSPEELRVAFDSVLGGVAAESIAHSCGSGVTACHNLFAMELAGLPSGRLYAGSWSEWIRDSGRPIETGG